MVFRNIRSMQKSLDRIFKKRIKISDEGQLLRLTGTCETWEEKVKAGLLCAKSGSRIHIVNDIFVKNEKESGPALGSAPPQSDLKLDGQSPDILIIGGGVIGCAIARELSKYQLQTMLLEKEYDVGIHASSRSDGMIHPGIDIKPGLLKKRLNNEGNRMYDKLSEELGLDFKRIGQYLCFDSYAMLPLMCFAIPYFNASVAGKAHLVMRKELTRREPGIGENIKFALYFDGAGILCPFNITIALAENAIENGVQIHLNSMVQSMTVSYDDSSKKNMVRAVHTNRGTIYPKLVINAAGVFSEELAKMAKDRFFSIHPRKGTSLILDKKAKKNINTIYSLLSSHSKKTHSKGGGIVSTIDGNVLVGPDAFETAEKEDFTSERKNVDAILEKHGKNAPWLSKKDVITYFSGIRAASYEEDFIVEKGRFTQNILHAAGIQSPGLTAAPAIAKEIAQIAIQLLSKNRSIEKNNHFNPKRHAIVRPTSLSSEERNALIKSNPDYGHIVCRCEEISKGEILDAMRRPLPCFTMDGIKRRVRPTAGRCQGSFCGPLVLQLIAQEKNIPMKDVCKAYPGSNILLGAKGQSNEQEKQQI